MAAIRPGQSSRPSLTPLIITEQLRGHGLPPTIIVVSGLPRSGTSLVMQMLRAAGVPVLEDGTRGPDDDNPRGYFEYGKTLRLWEDASWLDEAVGKAVKIVTPLVPALPFEYDVRVLLIERNPLEVMASQAAMLRRRGHDDRELASFAELGKTHLRVKRWIRYQRNVSCLELTYRGILDAPPIQAGRIASFLGLPLDCRAMADAVDPALHRQRRASA